mgnify:CR=1 FL=1
MTVNKKLFVVSLIGIGSGYLLIRLLKKSLKLDNLNINFNDIFI